MVSKKTKPKMANVTQTYNPSSRIPEATRGERIATSLELGWSTQCVTYELGLYGKTPSQKQNETKTNQSKLFIYIFIYINP